MKRTMHCKRTRTRPGSFEDNGKLKLNIRKLLSTIHVPNKRKQIMTGEVTKKDP